MTTINYKTKKVCAKRIKIELEKETVISVEFSSGCPGSQQAINRLISGMAVQDVIRRFRGIDCRGLGTSCPDQLAQALETVISQKDIVDSQTEQNRISS
jgi:uncharacterized protein (TIGR03905 family)